MFCSFLFLYQFGQILPSYYAPSLTHTDVREIPLRDMDFPLDIKVCIRPSVFNETALKHFGFKDAASYVLGVRKFNGSQYVFGWGGYDDQSITVTNASEVLRVAKKDWTKSNIITYFQMLPKVDNISWENTLQVKLQRINWINDCYVLNVDRINKNLIGMEEIMIFFNETILSKNNVTIELQLQGENLAANRDIHENLFYHTGDAMKLHQTSSISVKIKKKVFIEGEPGTTCRNYPNSKFKSYMECDNNYLRERVEEMAPGLVPVWMTDNLSKVSSEPVASSAETAGYLILIDTLPKFSENSLNLRFD